MSISRASRPAPCACGARWCSARDDDDGGRARAAEGLSAATRSRWSSTTGRGRRSARSTARSRWIRWRRIWRRRSARRNGDGAVRRDAVIVCRSAAELERMRAAGRLVGEVLTELTAAVAPGVTHGGAGRDGGEADRGGGATPAFKGYHGYPATICASINDEVIHGIPSGRGCCTKATSSRSTSARRSTATSATARSRCRSARCRKRRRRCCASPRKSLYKAIECVQAGRPGLGHRPRGAAARRGLRVFGGARVRRARHRPADARGAAGAELRRAGPRAAAGRGHGARDRADGERRASRR